MSDASTPRAVKGTVMSTSLKERLKRCGRYHAGSPASVTKATQALSPSHLTKSCSPPRPHSARRISCNSLSSLESLHKKNPTKRKVDLCSGSESSESDASFNKLSKNDSSLFGKRKAIQSSAEFSQNEIEILTSKHSLITREKNSLRTSHQQNNCDLLQNSDSISITNCSVVNSAKLPKNSGGLCDSGKEIPTTSSAENKQSLKSTCDFENTDSLRSQLQVLDFELKENLELLRKLKMVKMYREKNNLTDLQKLIDRWRSVSQTALVDLLSLHPEPRPSLGDLISHLQIEPGLVQYDTEEQDFL